MDIVTCRMRKEVWGNKPEKPIRKTKENQGKTGSLKARKEFIKSRKLSTASTTKKR